jgi:hypothetical protein
MILRHVTLQQHGRQRSSLGGVMRSDSFWQV